MLAHRLVDKLADMMEQQQPKRRLKEKLENKYYYAMT